MASSAIKTPAFAAKASNIQNEDGSSIYSGGEWSFKNASAVTGFHVDASGNVGIGTSSPTQKLDIVGPEIKISSNSGLGTRMTFTSTSTNGRTYQIGSNFSSGNGEFAIYDASAGAERMSIDANGRLVVYPSLAHNTSTGIVTANGYGGRAGLGGSASNVFNIHWTGSVPQLWIDTSNIGTISTSSDYRIKKNIETQELPALERIAQLRPVKYEFADYKELFKADGVQREGFIAHELQAVIPSAVDGEKDDENQIQSLKLDALCAVMVKAIQELSAKVDAQAAEIEALKAK